MRLSMKEHSEITYPLISLNITPAKHRRAYGVLPKPDDLRAMVKLLKEHRSAQVPQPDPSQDSSFMAMYNGSEELDDDAARIYADVGDYLISLVTHASLQNSDIHESNLPYFPRYITGRYKLNSIVYQAPCEVKAQIQPVDEFFTFDVDSKKSTIRWYAWGFEQNPKHVEYGFNYVMEAINNCGDEDWDLRIKGRESCGIKFMNEGAAYKDCPTPLHAAFKDLISLMKPIAARWHSGDYYVDWYGNMGPKLKEEQVESDYPIHILYKVVTDTRYKLSILIKRP